MSDQTILALANLAFNAFSLVALAYIAAKWGSNYPRK